MKTLLFSLVVLLVLHPFSDAALEKEMNGLRVAQQSGDKHAINMALIYLNSAASKYEAIDSSPVDNPTPERQQKRRDIMTELEPLKENLVLLFEGDDQAVASNAGILLGKTSGGPLVFDALKEALGESKNASLSSAALNSLYDLGLADEGVRNVAARRISAYKDENENEVAFALMRVAIYRPLPEALPICVGMFDSDASVSAKRIAAEILMKLGPAAAESLPQLRRFLAQLRAQGGDFRDINALERAVRAISVKTQQGATTPPVNAARLPVLQGATPVPSVSQITAVADPPKAVAPRRKSAWLWIVGIAGLALVAFLVFNHRSHRAARP